MVAPLLAVTSQLARSATLKIKPYFGACGLETRRKARRADPREGFLRKSFSLRFKMLPDYGGYYFKSIDKVGTMRLHAKTISLAASIAVTSFVYSAPVFADPIPAQFTSIGQDRHAIEALLTSYTTAVSTKNQSLFESLLLDKTIPFSGVDAIDRSSGAKVVTANYDDFCKSVFHGPPFTQRFQDVHIDQDGRLASASLVFINTDADGASWGWKTLQLLKINGRWKIASEFYTGHSGPTPKEP